MEPPLWPLFLQYIQQCSVNVNQPVPGLPWIGQQPVLPYVLSFPYILAMLVRMGNADKAVRIWKEVMGCETSFVVGMYVDIMRKVIFRGQIQMYLHRIAECEITFSDDHSYGWGLSTITCTEVEHLIDRQFGYLS